MNIIYEYRYKGFTYKYKLGKIKNIIIINLLINVNIINISISVFVNIINIVIKIINMVINILFN